MFHLFIYIKAEELNDSGELISYDLATVPPL